MLGNLSLRCGIPLLVVGLLSASVAQAGDLSATGSGAADDPWSSYLWGDWNGARTYFKARGVDLQLGYVSEVAYNATGGTKHLVDYTDQITGGITFDLDHLLGMHNAVFQTTFTQRNGRDLSSDAGLGTLQQVQELWGRGQTFRLTQFWFDQKYFDGAVDWKIGRLTDAEDFAAFSCDFENLTFCGGDPGNLVGNYIYNWPVSQWATRIKLNFRDFGYVQAGAFDVNPKYAESDDVALPVIYSGSTGVWLPLEIAWLPIFSNGTLPGSYKFGGWYDTSKADDVVSDVNGNYFSITGQPPRQNRGRYGAYVNFLQQVTRTSAVDPKGGLSVFFNAVFADQRTATTDYQIAGGLVYTGPFVSRPHDDIGFAVGTTHVNHRVADYEAFATEEGLGTFPEQSNEYVLELYYSLHPTNGFILRPNIQWVIDPGGTDDNKDVFVLGLKTVANF